MSFLNIVYMVAIMLVIGCAAGFTVCTKIRNIRLNVHRPPPRPGYWLLKESGTASDPPADSTSIHGAADTPDRRHVDIRHRQTLPAEAAETKATDIALASDGPHGETAKV